MDLQAFHGFIETTKTKTKKTKFSQNKSLY